MSLQSEPHLISLGQWVLLQSIITAPKSHHNQSAYFFGGDSFNKFFSQVFSLNFFLRLIIDNPSHIRKENN